MKQGRQHLAVVLCALAGALSACDSPTDARDDSLLTALPRQLSTSELAVVRSSNSFAFNVLRETVRQQPAPNVFLSPLSASLALGMTTNGATGATQDEMRAVLGFGELPIASMNTAHRSLIDLLRSLDRNVDMRIANSVWAQTGYPFQRTFYDTIAKYYDAKATTLDFSRADAAPTINRWVETNTAGKIDQIVPDPIPPGVVMYLINAIYFKGSWREPFDPDLTRDAPFRLADGTQKNVKLMSRKALARHHYDAQHDVHIAESTYGRGAFAMTLILPPENTDIDAFIATLDEAKWHTWTSALQEGELQLALPKFRIEYETLMNQPLMTLGMGRAFGPDADFSAMSPNGVFISRVVQKTFIDVNEQGTEAAAVTAVSMRDSAGQAVTFDRPFVLAIRERFSGAILFVGKVGNP